jgi:hypothetical protein
MQNSIVAHLSASSAAAVVVLLGVVCTHSTTSMAANVDPPMQPWGGPPSATETATVSVDMSGALTPFPHTWKRIFGAGHAALGLRQDFQTQLKRAVDELGLGGVRQHGLFDDDMGPVVIGPRR